ncbi:NAD(P)-binding protein [Candidatus Binatus sp.]|uniref:NAD(P)-binding protein n=1 Tax=Candidatus Binatus sp. TaxID=2811406 RepID=UPI003BB16C81
MLSKPIKVAVIGGGCASMAAAFELSRPEHQGKYEITIYQVGWRLGGKGASGRGVADRIEEHGLHIWMGFYENAFRLLRECYAELNRDPRRVRFADWRDAFSPEPLIGVLDRVSGGSWQARVSSFPPADGLPGDPIDKNNPFTIRAYFIRAIEMARVLLNAAQMRTEEPSDLSGTSDLNERWRRHRSITPDVLMEQLARLTKYSIGATITGVIEALGILQALVAGISNYAGGPILQFIETIASSTRSILRPMVESDDEVRWIWEITDLMLATMVGIVRFGLLTDPRGFDAINDFESREWLRINGASEGSLNSAMVRALYDLAFGYEDGDVNQPSVAAGQAIRGAFRMFFTYRGSVFWKMRSGMGDVVFAPFYEVLKKRGVRFQFFHRLENIKLAEASSLARDERCYVEALTFDVQAVVKHGQEYDPLIEVRGLPCWPSNAQYEQLIDGEQLKAQKRDFESHWDRRKVGTTTLRVVEDFDCVVLGVGLGAIPYLCRELIARDRRWRDLVTHCKTVATQSFQLWLREDVESLGWHHGQCSVAGFVHPFDTWADMRQLISDESWPSAPRGISYFCSVFPDSEYPRHRSDTQYAARCREIVKRNAITFLNRDARHLWPHSSRNGKFRWDLVVDPRESKRSAPRTSDESAFDSQFWNANVNPSDRYCLTVPGSVRFRISPLDNTYDNLTVAGDWTRCGFDQGCVEAAVMSGRLAAHAISGLPRLEDIVGYDHP